MQLLYTLSILLLISLPQDKPHGEQLLSLVTSVDIPPPIKGSKFPFAVHFSNKGSPWIINAFSEVELIHLQLLSAWNILLFSLSRRSARAGWKPFIPAPHHSPRCQNLLHCTRSSQMTCFKETSTKGWPLTLLKRQLLILPHGLGMRLSSMLTLTPMNSLPDRTTQYLPNQIQATSISQGVSSSPS